MGMRGRIRSVRARIKARRAKKKQSQEIVIRRFDPSRDSYEKLTELLHVAFARLGAMGLNCTCVEQTVAVTRARAEAGEFFVVEAGRQIIGTMTLYGRDDSSTCEHYRDVRVATLRQLAVDPSWQSLGVARKLLKYAEQWSDVHGYTELSLDTPYPAKHLVSFYQRNGFRFVRAMRFAGKLYDSAIMSKALVVAHTLAAWSASIKSGGVRRRIISI